MPDVEILDISMCEEQREAREVVAVDLDVEPYAVVRLDVAARTMDRTEGDLVTQFGALLEVAMARDADRDAGAGDGPRTQGELGELVHCTPRNVRRTRPPILVT